MKCPQCQTEIKFAWRWEGRLFCSPYCRRLATAATRAVRQAENKMRQRGSRGR